MWDQVLDSCWKPNPVIFSIFFLYFSFYIWFILFPWSQSIQSHPIFTVPYFFIHLVTLNREGHSTHSSALAWKIPWAEEPGGLQSMGSRRIRHDWVTSLSLFTFMHWRKKWLPTPVFFPGESQGWESLLGCCLWGRTESERLKQLSSSSSIQ